MEKRTRLYDAVVTRLSGPIGRALALFATRLSLAGIFWRAGRSKVEEGSWFSISDATYFLFDSEYSGVPLPPEWAAVMATAAEHVFPILLVLGLFTRLSALALLGMTMVIQIFVYPEAWWSVHMIWASLSLILITHGAGAWSLDHGLIKMRRA